MDGRGNAGNRKDNGKRFLRVLKLIEDVLQK